MCIGQPADIHISDSDIEELYRQVNKYALVSNFNVTCYFIMCPFIILWQSKYCNKI